VFFGKNAVFPRQKVERFACENALTLDVTLKRLILNGPGDHYGRFDTLSSELVGFATFPHGADEGIHSIGAFPLHSHRRVGVGGEGKRGGRVTEILLHRLDVVAGLQAVDREIQ